MAELRRLGIRGVMKQTFNLVRQLSMGKFLSYINMLAVINYIEKGNKDGPVKNVKYSPKRLPDPEKLKRIYRSGLLRGALIIGHAYGVFGRGSTLRMSVSAFDRGGIPFHIQNIWGDLGKDNITLFDNFQFADKITTGQKHKANVFFLNADEMKAAYDYLGGNFFRGSYNIGYWAWELSHFPDQWVYCFQYLDEIWAMTEFVKESFEEKAPCPVIHMPLTIEVRKPGGFDRSGFGLPSDKFIFLFFFDFNSYISRKNPYAAINAFRRAFSADDKGVSLVIKMIGTEKHMDEYCKLVDFIQDDPRIITVNTPLSDREMQGLLEVSDCFVSLHRSEGFGQGIAEAMAYGKPVIATGYSGNLDFNNETNSCLVNYRLIPVKAGEYPYGEGQVWADPDIDHAAWYMKRLVSDEGYRNRIGKLGADFIRTHHSPAAVGARYRARLQELGLL